MPEFGLSMFIGRYEKMFLLNLQQNHTKMIAESLSIVWRFIKVDIQTSEFVTLCFICPVTILPPIQIYLKFIKILNLTRKFIKYIDSSLCEIRPVNEFV